MPIAWARIIKLCARIGFRRVEMKTELILGISMLSIFRKLMKNDDGATAIEYVLIGSLISVAAIAAMARVGGKVSNVLSNVANAMT